MNALFSITTSQNKTMFTLGEQTNITLKNIKNKDITNLQFFINNTPITKETYTFKLPKLGVKTLKATFNYNNTLIVIKKTITLVAKSKPKVLQFKIINEYPHDINAYTQGLEFYNGILYESTGQRGKSSLREVDYNTGKVIRQIDLNDNYFGEGLTVLNNQIYQLTWQSKIGFIYDLNNFNKSGTFTYKKSKEGWGLCNDGKTIYKSDGTEKIWRLNAETLEEESYIEVYTNNSKIDSLNELEWVNGDIYSNIYQSNGIAIINPETGAVKAVVNCNSLKEKVTQHPNLDVINGIAYNKNTDTFFVTGKNWDKLFEIKLLH